MIINETRVTRFDRVPILRIVSNTHRPFLRTELSRYRQLVLSCTYAIGQITGRHKLPESLGA